MNPSISVIVLAYNAVNTLRRSLDSILRQTHEDFELIAIDDGSTDDTGRILDLYAQTDSRINVIHQENAGVAISRQKGIDQASGVYSIFVDADDWIEPTMLEDLFRHASETNADIVFCDFMEYNGLGTFYRKQEPCSRNSQEVLKQMLGELHGSLWNKLIRRSLYQDRGIRFLKGLNYCEDEYVVVRLLSEKICVGYVGKALYHYDKLANLQSISNNWKARPLEEYAIYLQHLLPIFNTHEVRRNFDNRVGAVIYKLSFSSDNEYRGSKRLLINYFSSFIHSNLPLKKKAFCILYYFGMKKPLERMRESYSQAQSGY